MIGPNRAPEAGADGPLNRVDEHHAGQLAVAGRTDRAG